MGRKPRVHYSGAIYHVIARGNNKENVFKEKSDFQRYIDLINKYKKKFDFFLYAYVLMDNHIHMLIEVKEHPLSKIMQGLQLSYTQYFNKKYNHVGHVFQQRYKAHLCDNYPYLWTLIKYIHNNPIKAGISEDYNYSWSSHKHYINSKNSFVDIYFPLSFFSKDRGKAIKGYLEFLENEIDENIQDDFLEKKYTGNNMHKLNADSKGYKLVLELDDILGLVSKKVKLKPEDIRKSSRKRKIVKLRRLVMYLAIELNIASRKQLAEYLNISESNVTRGYYSFIQCEEELKWGEELKKKITQ